MHVCAYMSVSIHLLMQVYVCVCIHVRTGVFGDQKVATDSFELELCVVVL